MSIEKPKVGNERENIEKSFFHGIEIPNVLISYRRNEMFDSTVPDFINKLSEMGYNVKTLLFYKENSPEEINEIVLQNEELLKSSPLKFFDGTVKKEFDALRQQKGEEFAKLGVYGDEYEKYEGIKDLDNIFEEAVEKEALSFIGVSRKEDIFRKIENVKTKDPTEAIEFEGKILSGLLKQVREKPELSYVCKNNITDHIKFESPEKGLETVISWLKEAGLNVVAFNNNIKTTERDWVVADRHYNDIEKKNLPAKTFELPVPDFVQKLFTEKLIDINPKEAIISKIKDEFNIEKLLKQWYSREFYVTKEQFLKMKEEIEKEKGKGV